MIKKIFLIISFLVSIKFCHGIDMDEVYKDLKKVAAVQSLPYMRHQVLKRYYNNLAQCPNNNYEEVKALKDKDKKECLFQLGLILDSKEHSPMTDPYMSHIEAVHKYFKAAALGCAKANTMLGLMLLCRSDDGSTQYEYDDLMNDAYDFFKSAALGGDKTGELMFGLMQIHSVEKEGENIMTDPTIFFRLSVKEKRTVSYGLGWVIGSGYFCHVIRVQEYLEQRRKIGHVKL